MSKKATPQWETPWRRPAAGARLAGTVLSELIGAPLSWLDPFQTQFRKLERAEDYRAREVKLPGTVGEELVVMSWNIKFGGGRIDFWFDGHDERVHMEETEVRANLAGVVEKICQVDPDVLLIQEVDVNSRRVAFIDQMQWLLDHTALNFGVYASQWRAHFVPAHGIGKVDMGNAILSKFPLRDGRRIALPQMEVQDRLTRYFYLKRHILTARVELPGLRPLHVVNTHAEAFAQDDTKKRHLECFEAELERIHRAGGVFVAGGDLNTLPPGSRQTAEFADVSKELGVQNASDYRREEDWLQGLYQRYEEVVDLEAYRRDNAPYFTHSTHKETFWNRKLDYLFTNARYVRGSTMTHQDEMRGGLNTMALSDHAPISARLARQELCR